MTDQFDTDAIKSSFLSREHWLRLVYMLLFALMLHVASIAMWVLCAMQFLFTLFTDKDNENLRILGKSLTVFIGQALDFLTYNTESKPFPFDAWPVNGVETSHDGSLTVPVEPHPDATATQSTPGMEPRQAPEPDPNAPLHDAGEQGSAGEDHGQSDPQDGPR